MWSPDQEIQKKGKEKIVLKIKTASEPEIVSWVLSFGPSAKVLSPGWLVEKVRENAEQILLNHSSDS